MSENQETYLDEILSLARVLNAPREKVFAAWTDPDLLAQWWGPPGSVVKDVEIELQVGGRYRIDFEHANGQSMEVGGVYEDIQPPSKLSFTWRWANSDMDIGTSLVTIDFQNKSGKTGLSLTHERLPNEDARRGHAEGWTGILSNLENFFANKLTSI